MCFHNMMGFPTPLLFDMFTCLRYIPIYSNTNLGIAVKGITGIMETLIQLALTMGDYPG